MEHSTVIIGLALFLLILLYFRNINSEKKQVPSDKNPETFDTQQISNQSQNQTKAALRVYYTEWCGFSQSFLKEWNQNLLPAIANDPIKDKVNFETVDCDKNKDLCNTYKIAGYPTILLHTTDGNVKEYDGARQTANILDFVKSNV
uniref:Thioredoxin domain-containing protein n=1 Tax=viral metagenome TaxID=1070528 RepID=A0A6C0EB63_9ZZZZ